MAFVLDDFPSMTVPELVTSAVAVSEGLMSILGWNVSREPLKYLPFMSQFVSLGVQVDLSLLSWRTSWLLTTNLAGSLLLLHLFVEQSRSVSSLL